MLTWKVILQVICVVILTVLVFFFAVPYLMEGIGSIHPIFFEMEEEMRCHLFQRHGICLSLYPSSVKEGETVHVTFRARRWYTGQACVAEKVGPPYEAVGCCILTKGKCKTNFTATLPGGTYFAFINNFNPSDMMWEEQEPKGEEKKLIVNPA